MTVQELIAQLRTMDPKLRVCTHTDGTVFTVRQALVVPVSDLRAIYVVAGYFDEEFVCYL